MGKERKIVGIWPADDGATPLSTDGATAISAPTVDTDGSAHEEVALDLVDYTDDVEAYSVPYGDDDTLPSSRASAPWAAIIAGLLAVGWLGFLGWYYSGGVTRAPAMADVPELAIAASAPMAVVLLLLLLIDRLSLHTLQRHQSLLISIHTAHNQMRATLAATDQAWRDAQAALEARGENVTASVTDAAMRIEAITRTLDQRMHDVVHNSTVVTGECDAASRALQGVLNAMPKAEEVARRAAESMRLAGQSAYQFGGQLEARIAAIQTEAAASEQALAQADAKLAERLEALIAATGAAEQGASQAGEKFAAVLSTQRDAALTTLADLAAGMETSVNSAEMRLATAREALAKASEHQLAALDDGITRSHERVTAIGSGLEQALYSSSTLDDALTTVLASTQQRIAALEAEVEGRLATLAQGMAGIESHAGRLASTLDDSSSKAATLGDSSARLMQELRNVASQVETDVPALFDQLTERLSAVRAALEALPQTLTQDASRADAVLTSVQQSSAIIATQAATMEQAAELARVAHAAQAEQVTAVQAAIDRIVERIDSLKQEIAPALHSSIAQSEATANDAATRIRQSMAGIVDDSAQDLGRALDETLAQIASDKVVAQLNQIATTADGAVGAANAASERLMRQLITITETTKALESRAADVSASLEAHSRETLARQMALLNESLQSTAVDLTRMLSTDVADQAWGAYLKGDRGIFTRRAVTLLSAAEARAILGRYQAEEDFRGHVNRYVHDFEAMLRGVMDTRDGGALSVTLLSSDIGKVYVALAQAIERLRG